ncbi:MAG: SGNH/GDSL hydrolase family protein [Chitinophagaceae bacterium]
MLRPCLIIPFFLLLIAIQYSCVKDNAVGGQSPSTPPVAPGTPAPSSASQKKYLALGDSYTAGQGVPAAERYPIQTKNWLVDHGITGLADPQIIATSGWTTTNLQTAIVNQNPTGPYDMVSLLIGVNDQYREMDTTKYRNRFTELLQRSISLANNLPSHVFVLSIPDYSVTPFAMYFDVNKIKTQIDEFNEINKQVSLSFQVQYLDITPSTREAKNNPALLCSDGLHPSGLEYKKWAEKLGPLMKTVLP